MQRDEAIWHWRYQSNKQAMIHLANRFSLFDQFDTTIDQTSQTITHADAKSCIIKWDVAQDIINVSIKQTSDHSFNQSFSFTRSFRHIGSCSSVHFGQSIKQTNNHISFACLLTWCEYYTSKFGYHQWWSGRLLGVRDSWFCDCSSLAEDRRRLFSMWMMKRHVM